MDALLARYEFWLVALAVLAFAAERLAPWRRGQRLLRPQLAQDLFWLLGNGSLFAVLFGGAFVEIEALVSRAVGFVCGGVPEQVHLVGALPFVPQVIVVLLVADLFEWLVHNALHRVGILWRFHRVHHSIQTMDWIGNFRFHWVETFVYRTAKYAPLALLGARWDAVLVVSVFSTAMGNLNHANLDVTWGPLRYVLNSPRMHVWHHEKERPGPGVNFGVVLCVWDWLFGTAHMPPREIQPEAFGFRGMERVPDSLLMRLFAPFVGS